jgi:NTP pyrophosphatase (non-canonical NTP hydrolase)
MDFVTYQKQARVFSKDTRIEASELIYPLLGLSSEVGEVMDKCKKVFRDNSGEFSKEIRLEIMKEIGDVLWYLSELCSQFSFDFDDVANMNIDKLSSRKLRGAIGGSGDNR